MVSPIRKKRKSTAINTVEELQEILKSVYQIVDIRDVESFVEVISRSQLTYLITILSQLGVDGY